MFKLKKTFAVIGLFAMLAGPALSQTNPDRKVKILFIPLDDRPPCYQFTEQMALIGDVELVTAPKDLVGRFTKPGESDKIIGWMNRQDLNSFDAAIIAIDMLAYGGLVGSRVYSVNAELALKRIEHLGKLRNKFPKLKIYAQNVIMRLAPTADGKNESYRADLAKWAEISVQGDALSKKETQKLEARIPPEGLAQYKAARSRNLRVNLQAIQYVKTGVIDYLILSQDDAKPVGIHVSDRLQLQAETKRYGLNDRIAVQPGADEVSMLLLSRALNKHYNLTPTIKSIYSSELASKTVMPFEDKPLHETVSYHIAATGARQVKDEKDADLLFYVFASRKDPGRAETFAKEIEDKVRAGKKLIVADIDPVGDVQGGDSVFTRELLKRKIFPELNSYSSWNTAANTIGTTLPQGVVFFAAEKKLFINEAAAARIWTAQNWFTLHRVLDDYYFHGLNRLLVNRHFDQNKLSSKILSDAENTTVEQYGTSLMLQSFKEISGMFSEKIEYSRQQKISCQSPSDLKFTLPWNRTFEAEIDFKISCINRLQ